MSTLLALLALQGPATEASAKAADFFPLVPGTRRIYEVKAEATSTLVDEVGEKPAYFDGTEAIAVVQKSQFNQVLNTTYYRVEGSTVMTVGYAEDRTAATPNVGDTVDLTRAAAKRHVLLQLAPAMPVFKYEGKETSWAYGEVPTLKAVGDDLPIKLDETLIKGTAKPVGLRTVLGRKVEAIEVKAEVQIGSGKLGQRIVETSVYGRGIGLVEALRKTSGGGEKPKETRTRLVGIEEKSKPG